MRTQLSNSSLNITMFYLIGVVSCAVIVIWFEELQCSRLRGDRTTSPFGVVWRVAKEVCFSILRLGEAQSGIFWPLSRGDLDVHLGQTFRQVSLSLHENESLNLSFCFRECEFSAPLVHL